MFRQQLRAMLRAAAHGRVRILLPMVAQLSEVRLTIEALARARPQLEDAGRAYGAVELGAMVEIPAAALMLPRFLRYFEFVSIGTNDLIQYTLAIDRADEAVAHLYDPWHPAVLQLVAQTVACARRMRKDVSVCGEMAGDPAFTELLLGMGLRSFSMHPSQLLTVKERVLGTDASRWARALDRVLGADDPEREVAMLASEISAPRGGPLVAAASSL
jgi:phosphotransferase system enzyme I (PtsI)